MILLIQSLTKVHYEFIVRFADTTQKPLPLIRLYEK